MIPADVNFLAVLVAAVAYMVIGALWYSSLMFGNYWIKLMGLTDKKTQEMKKAANKAYAFSTISALVMSYVLAVFIRIADISMLTEGLYLGFIVWLGFVATITLQSVVFEGKSKELFVLNNGYNLVGILVMAAILSTWA